jgi:hypothetical protein
LSPMRLANAETHRPSRPQPRLPILGLPPLPRLQSNQTPLTRPLHPSRVAQRRGAPDLRAHYATQLITTTPP